MSDKITPALVAAVLFASTGFAFAQAPSAEGAGQGLYGQAPVPQTLAPSPYQGLSGYYNSAPNGLGYGSGYRKGSIRDTRPQNGSAW